MDRVVDIEQQVLTVTCCKISPIFTPTNFLHHMISLIPDLDCNRKCDLLRNADLLIAEFWGGKFTYTLMMDIYIYIVLIIYIFSVLFYRIIIYLICSINNCNFSNISIIFLIEIEDCLCILVGVDPTRFLY